VKNHWEKAVELNPSDATSHHLLGRCIHKTLLYFFTFEKLELIKVLFKGPLA
jgi:hypothetical protein